MKKTLAKLLLLFAVAVVLTGIVLAGMRILNQNYLFVRGTLIARDARQVDLAGKQLEDLEFLRQLPNMSSLDVRDTGLTVSEYDWLCREFPDCHICWDVPFQGSYYSCDAEKLRLTSLTDAEVEQLDYFPVLTSIDAWDCPDLPQLLVLQQRRPECKVFYFVPMGGESWPCDTVYMTLRDADAGELMEKLAYLPQLQTLLLTGILPEGESLQRLQETYPNTAISWLVELEGATYERSADRIDLSGAGIKTVAEAEELLSYFPELKQADMTDCGLSDADMMALANRFPETYFIFSMTIAGVTVSTVAEEIDLSGQELGDVTVIEEILPYFPNLQKVVACGCGISSEDMAAMSQRYPQIRFVWSVDLAGLLLRTDATYFMPNKYGVKCTDANIYDLRYCVDMICVDVGHAENVTNCEWAAYMPKLKYLVLADSGVHDIAPLAGLTDLVFLELFQSRVKDYSPLLSCTGLEDLNLCYTYGSPEPIARMTWLKRLWWSGSWTARTLLPEKLPDTLLEFDTLSSTGDGWREGQHYYDMRDIVGMGYMTG